MALTLYECWQVAQQPTFQARVRFCLNKAAVSVLGEAAATPGHADRVIFARKVLTGFYNLEHTAMAVWTVAPLKESGNINNETTSGVNDAELQTAIDDLFSALSGFDAGA